MRIEKSKQLAAAIAFSCTALSLVGDARGAEAAILYLERRTPPPPVLSNLDPAPEDEGLMGARLGLADNATTGSFLGHSYSLEEIVVSFDETFNPEAFSEASIIVANMPAADLLALAEARPSALIFNASASDDDLRDEACRGNVLHTAPSRAMLTDALAQFLVKRKWDEWFLIEGESDEDAAFAAAVRRSAAKFGADIEAERVWRFDADMRRSASTEAPLFTQGEDYDVLIVADEREDFGRYLAYNTWDPRPVAGTEGLTPSAWAPVVEQWGAAQLHSRFDALAGRDMTAIDYAVWAAVRAVGEAVTRTNSAEVSALRAFLLSEAFQLAAFKGRKMSFRAWNGQLRQPIPLSHPRAMVAMAPMEGYLHQRTELDTLGLDEPESACAAFD